MIATIHVTGLRDFNRANRRLEKGARKEVRDRLKGVGQIIATQAQENARAQMTSRTGDLVRKIKPTASARGVIITASARHGGYAYPRRLEFDKKLGPKPFLYPAVEQKQEEAWAEFEKVMDWVEREFLR